jgi:hypothetical protein
MRSKGERTKRHIKESSYCIYIIRLVNWLSQKYAENIEDIVSSAI